MTENTNVQLSPASCLKHHPRVVEQTVASETVLFLPESGIKVLNEVGGRMWQLVNGERLIQEIADTINKEYQVDPAQSLADTLEFLSLLSQRGLVLIVERPASPETRAD